MRSIISSLLPAGAEEHTEARLLALNTKASLTLAPAEAHMLALAGAKALQSTHRLEFGTPAVELLAAAFGASPMIAPEEYADTLAELADIFYHFKNQAGHALSDEELVAEMYTAFHTTCLGSLDLLRDREMEALIRRLRGYEDEQPDPPESVYDE